MGERLPTTEWEAAFNRVPRWRPCGANGSGMERQWEFRGFKEAIGFVYRVAELAEKANHHPDIEIRFRRVRLFLTTHDAGGLTARDFDLAERVDALEGAE